jgi:lipid-A-disaccharide synthase-like uncharacterized protein
MVIFYGFATLLLLGILFAVQFLLVKKHRLLGICIPAASFLFSLFWLLMTPVSIETSLTVTALTADALPPKETPREKRQIPGGTQEAVGGFLFANMFTALFLLPYLAVKKRDAPVG